MNRGLFSEALYQPSNLTVVLAACPGSEGVQDVPPSNMLLLRIDYSELKALEKQQVQEGLSDPFHLKTGHEISYKKDAFPVSGSKDTSSSPETGNCFFTQRMVLP